MIIVSNHIVVEGKYLEMVLVTILQKLSSSHSLCRSEGD